MKSAKVCVVIGAAGRVVLVLLSFIAVIVIVSIITIINVVISTILIVCQYNNVYLLNCLSYFLHLLLAW